MSQRIEVIMEDDIDGGDAVETVRFGLDGTNYEIDLNERNAAALRKALSKYLDHARKVRRNPSGKSAGPSAVGGHSAREIRAWANQNGIQVPDRGRVPEEVRQQFADAH